MEIVAKVSKGSKMDQIYLPKKREGFAVGNYVIVTSLDAPKVKKERLYFYNLEDLEPLKLEIVREIIKLVDKKIEMNNLIITGSFLDKGFNFNDIDIVLITNKRTNIKNLEKDIEIKINIKTHVILLDNKTLIQGLSTDPLYQMMLSKCIAKKRFIYRLKQEINYKILDLHLLKSKTLIHDFDILNGNEKYSLVRNLVAITLYLKDRKISKKKVDKEIERYFRISLENLKQNILNKTDFIKKYKALYNKTFEIIMKGVKDASK